MSQMSERILCSVLQLGLLTGLMLLAIFDEWRDQSLGHMLGWSVAFGAVVALYGSTRVWEARLRDRGRR